MKNLCTWLSASALLGFSLAQAEPREFEIDPEHFSVGFLVSHIGYKQQLGMFREAEGHFVWDEDANELHSGEVVIQADSVFTNHDRRDRHLRSGDFLHARRHGAIRFEATHWEPREENSGTLRGELSLLGQTHPVDLDVTINRRAEYPFGHEEYTVGMSARTTIQRSQWGMSYALEDGLVGDDVELILEFEAIAR
ncbi:MAG: YceI family protein [Wenzhouxiangella sp.]|nr:MAG: YceI family protein [Wenzhouxiangella sp.]